MADQIAEHFSFASRPIPVPGDLRIEWRIALIALMLGYSRAAQASIAKLHLLNDAVRAGGRVEQLDAIATSKVKALPWILRVEPAFARAIDFIVGDELAEWTQSASRTALKLTVKGKSAFQKLSDQEDVLRLEKEILGRYAKEITEGTVTLILGSGRKV